MAISLAWTNKTVHRYDDTALPNLSISGIGTGANGRIFFHSYKPYGNGNQNVEILYNRSEPESKVRVLEVNPTPTFGSSGDITLFPGIKLQKTSGVDGFSGAYAPSVGSGYVSIEGQFSDVVNNSTAIALSNFGNAYNFLGDPNIKHCMVFGANNDLSIFEETESVFLGKYDDGVSGFIELTESGIVNYYIIPPGTARIPVLIRTVRSKLTYPVFPEFILYHVNSFIALPFVSAQTSTILLETIGVLNGFEDWQNSSSINSTYEGTVLKSGRRKFFTYSPKERFRQWDADLAFREYDEWLIYQDFWNWHGMEKEFIFRNISHEHERWARFTAPFSDPVNSANQFSIKTSLEETMRNDHLNIIIPPTPAPVVDLLAPSAPSGLVVDAMSYNTIHGIFTGSVDNIGVDHYEVERAMNSSFSMDLVVTNNGLSLDFTATGLISSTTYYFRVRAFDAAGNASLYSNISSAITEDYVPEPLFFGSDPLEFDGDPLEI